MPHINTAVEAICNFMLTNHKDIYGLEDYMSAIKSYFDKKGIPDNENDQVQIKAMLREAVSILVRADALVVMTPGGPSTVGLLSNEPLPLYYKLTETAKPILQKYK